MAHGLDLRLPICTPQLVQYVFNTPWSTKTFDGREKSLLREATRDVLPASIVDRKKSPYPWNPPTQDRAYERALREQLRALVDADESPVLELLDHVRVTNLLNREVGEVSLQSTRANAEIVLVLHDRLTTTGARLDFPS